MADLELSIQKRKAIFQKLNNVILILYGMAVFEALLYESMFVLEETPLWKGFWKGMLLSITACVCVKMYLLCYDLKKYILPVCLILVTVTAIGYVGNAGLLTMTLLMVGAYGIPFDYYAYVFLAVSIPFRIIQTIGSQTGLISDLVFKGRGSNIGRHSLGANSYTNYAGPMLSLFLMHVYVNRHKHNWIPELVVATPIVFFIYRFTDSRTNAVLAILVLLLLLLDTLTHRLKSFTGIWHKVVGVGAKILFPILILLTFILPFLYSEEAWYNQIYLLKTLCYRMRLMKEALLNYPVTLLGQRVRIVGYGGNTWMNLAKAEGYNAIDNGYLYMFVTGGLLVLLLVIFIYERALIRADKSQNYWMSVIISVYALQCFVDNNLWFASRDMLLILLFASVPLRNPVVAYAKAKYARYLELMEEQKDCLRCKFAYFKYNVGVLWRKYRLLVVLYLVTSVLLLGGTLLQNKMDYAEAELNYEYFIDLSSDTEVYQEFNTMSLYHGVSVPIRKTDGSANGNVILKIGVLDSDKILVEQKLPLSKVENPIDTEVLFKAGSYLAEGQKLYMTLRLDDTPGAMASVCVTKNNRTDYMGLLKNGENQDEYAEKALGIRLMYRYNTHTFVLWMLVTGLMICVFYVLAVGFPGVVSSKKRKIAREDEQEITGSKFIHLVNSPPFGVAYGMPLHLRIGAYLACTLIFLLCSFLVCDSTVATDGSVVDYKDEAIEWGMRIDENNSYFQKFTVEDKNLNEIRIYLESYEEIDPLIVSIDDADMNILYQTTLDQVHQIAGLPIVISVPDLKSQDGLELKLGQQYILGVFAVHNEENYRPNLMQVSFYYAPSIDAHKLLVISLLLVVLLVFGVSPKPVLVLNKVSKGAREILWGIFTIGLTYATYMISGGNNGYLSPFTKHPTFEKMTSAYGTSWLAAQEAMMDTIIEGETAQFLWYRVFFIFLIALLVFGAIHLLWGYYWPHHRIALAVSVLSVFAGIVLYRRVPYAAEAYLDYETAIGIMLVMLLMELVARIRVMDRSDQRVFTQKLQIVLASKWKRSVGQDGNAEREGNRQKGKSPKGEKSKSVKNKQKLQKKKKTVSVQKSLKRKK